MTQYREQNLSDPAKTSQSDALHTAVRILTHRDHSRYELKQKLQKRGFTREAIEAALAECVRLHYIDDERTAQLYISQLKRKCFGKRYIRMALKKKRLSGAVAGKILLESYSEVEEREIGGRLLQKKIKTFTREDDLKKRRDKIYRFLNSRGFNKDVIADLIRDLVK